MAIFVVPFGPPANVTAVADSSTGITVSWDMVPPIDQNGIIIFYEVRYQVQETPGERTVNVTGLSANLMDLEAPASYDISVRAYTSTGEGPYSMPIRVTILQGKIFEKMVRIHLSLDAFCVQCKINSHILL